MRKSNLFLSATAFLLFLLLIMFIHASMEKKAGTKILQAKREMAERLQIADLCLFTEASYTRHLSQADFHTPFQDAPLSFEHFPSGSLAAPPLTLRKPHEKMD
jgi:hypothetical protein